MILTRQRFLSFFGVSGVGLGLDYAVYTALCHAGMPAGWANLISASVAVTFVFVVSARRIFHASDHFLLGKFVVYALYQAAAISAASYAVGAATELFGGRYLLGKTVVVPFSFTANYLFVSWLFSAARGQPNRP